MTDDGSHSLIKSVVRSLGIVRPWNISVIHNADLPVPMSINLVFFKNNAFEDHSYSIEVIKLKRVQSTDLSAFFKMETLQ